MNARRRKLYKRKGTQQGAASLYYGLTFMFGCAWIYAGINNTSEHPLALIATLPVTGLGLWMVIIALKGTTEVAGLSKERKRMRERRVGVNGFNLPPE